MPPPTDLPSAADVLRFWFDQTPRKAWFSTDTAFDAQVRERFGALLDAASQGECEGWRRDASGRLAEIVVLDQFSRNIHRGSARAFAQDGMALVLAQEAVRRECHRDLPLPQRLFLLMPYMHSESRRVHQQALALFREFAPADNLDFEIRHKAIIDRFGRYPHRNEVLGRASTPEELEFLRQPGSRF